MKKIKILTPVLTCATLVSAIPTLATTSCAGNKNENKKEEKHFVNENLFNVENGVLKGFRAGVTQKEIDDYTKSGVLALPACRSIGASAFKGISMPFADEIIIDNTTVVIEDYAFYGCSTVTDVQWQDAKSKESKLEQIGKSAFAFCTNLKGFKFGPHFSEILENAFYGCKNLRTLDFSSFVTSEGYADIYTLTHNVRIGKNAFLGVLPAETYSSLMIELAPLDEYTIRDPFQLRFSLGDLATKICLNTDWTASNRPGWLKGHAPNVDAFNIDTVIPYEDIPEEHKESWLTITEDGLLDIKEEHKQELQNTIFNGLFVPNEIDRQPVTGISENFWNYAGKNLVDADMSNIQFPEDTTGPIMGLKIPNDFAYDSERAVSKCPNIQNIKFNSGVNLIGDRAFFKSTNLEYVNLNQMNNLRSIGEYAFANTSVRCFGEAPTAAPTWHDEGSWCDAHTIQYLKINATSLLRIGTAAFNNSLVEGIKFTCDQSMDPPIPLDFPPKGAIGFSVGDYAFGNCRILGFDLSDLHYDATVEMVDSVPTLSILGLESIEGIIAPQMVAFIAGAIINLFAPSTSGLAGRHIFDGSLHFSNGNGETSQNQVIPPSIKVVSGGENLPNDLSIPELAIAYFRDGVKLTEFVTESGAKINFVGMTGGLDYPELDKGLQELIVTKTAAASDDQKAFLNENKYPIYGPNANYKFQCDYDQTEYIQQIYQVSGEPTFQKEFQFRCDLTSAGMQQHMVVDTTYTTIAVGSKVLMYDKEWTYNPQTSTITINGDNVIGDIYVDLRLRVGSINITQDYVDAGEYHAYSSVSEAGYIGQPIYGTIYISTEEGGKPNPNFGLSNFTVKVGQKTLVQGVEYYFNRLAEGNYELNILGEYVTGDVTITGNVDAAEFEFYGTKGAGVQNITYDAKPKYNTDFTFRVDLDSDDYIIDTDKLSVHSDSGEIPTSEITIVKDTGGKPAYNITIPAAYIDGNISANVYAKKPTTFQWINNPVDPEHIGQVTCGGTTTVTELKDAEFKIELKGEASNIDVTTSRVAVKGTNILTNAEAYTLTVDSGYAILTIKGAYVTGYIVLVLYGQTA